MIYGGVSRGFVFAQKPDALHAASGACSLFAIMRPNADGSGTGTIVGNVTAASQRGFAVVYDQANQGVGVYIADASGVYEVISSGAGGVPRNNPYLLEYHRAGTTITVVVNGVTIINQVATKLTDITATNPTAFLNSTISPPNYFRGSLGDMFFAPQAFSPDQIAKTRAWFRRRYAI
jgi:hypothetical protein